MVAPAFLAVVAAIGKAGRITDAFAAKAGIRAAHGGYFRPGTGQSRRKPLEGALRAMTTRTGYPMKSSILGQVAARLDFPDLRLMPEERLTPARLRIELLSGLTVALALVPEAVAFAFVAGVHPLVGLYAAFLVGLITALIGGRPGMISGATGALAVVMVALVAEHGVEYLFATVVLMGLIQIVAGIMQWGKFIRLVPGPTFPRRPPVPIGSGPAKASASSASAAASPPAAARTSASSPARCSA